MGSHKTVKIIAILIVLALIPMLGFAQVNYGSFRDSFQQFSEDVANSLPLNAAIGNNSPDAYIGQLLRVPPNFSVGITAGASTIPYDTVKNVFGDLSLTVPSELEDLKNIGVPFPAATVDARVGGFILPFDVGVKFGTLPGEVKALLPSNMDAEFLLAGADVRYALMKGGAAKPTISVGIGYNYLSGSVTVKDVTSGYTIDVPGTTNDPGFSDPDVTFEWNTSVIDLKAQVSKRLLIFTPYAGAGAAVAVSSAGGGISSELEIGGSKATPAQIDQLKSDLQAAGYPIPDELSADNGIQILSDSTGWAFRIYGGTAINILMMHIDLGAGYDLLGKNLQGTVGVRFQL